tara:strand:+ start:260 stop:673 length:414 start_codon:yes stop_codon:yes gene_type:complete
MGNFLDCFKNEKEQYASFINDNLLLTNIQERLEDYDEKVTKINDSVGVMKSSYSTLIKDLRAELNEVKRDYIQLERKHNQLNNDFTILNIENKSQVTKINELNTKIETMENENIFLEKSMDITQSSKYLDTESQFSP